jgi:hypothetical protein
LDPDPDELGSEDPLYPEDPPGMDTDPNEKFSRWYYSYGWSDGTGEGPPDPDLGSLEGIPLIRKGQAFKLNK